MAKTGGSQEIKELDLINSWEAEGYAELAQARLYDPRHQQIINVGEQLPAGLTLSAAILVFLATLAGQSKQTHKTYRVGCRRLMWFVYSTDRGLPDQLPLVELSATILEDFYLWLVETYGKQNRATIGAYLAGARNLFDYLSSRELSPGGVQYSKMVARLGKMQGRASYKTPHTLRIKGRQAQIEQVAHLAVAKSFVTGSTPIAETTLPGPITDTSPLPGNPLQTIKPEQPLPPTELTARLENDQSQSTDQKQARRPASSAAEELRQQLEEARDRAIILALFTTGMRREELTRLNRTELEALLVEWHATSLTRISQVADNKANKIEETEPNRFVYELIITGKGQKERLVYFDEVTLEKVEQYLKLRGKDNYRPLFLQHHRGRASVKAGPGGEGYRVGERTVWVVVKKYAARLGLELKPHDFRHNLATTLLNAGAQLSEVQDILGHASPTTTKQIYAHYDKGHLKQAFARFGKSADDLT